MTYRTHDLAAECERLRGELAAAQARLHPRARRPGRWADVAGIVAVVAVGVAGSAVLSALDEAACRATTGRGYVRAEGGSR